MTRIQFLSSRYTGICPPLDRYGEAVEYLKKMVTSKTFLTWFDFWDPGKLISVIDFRDKDRNKIEASNILIKKSFEIFDDDEQVMLAKIHASLGDNYLALSMMPESEFDN